MFKLQDTQLSSVGNSQKLINITLSNSDKENVEEIVEKGFKICDSYEDINGVRMDFGQIDAEETIEILESLIEKKYEIETTKMIITATDTDLRN